jgi:steroid delta-isomerase-like uncharacterized protein
MNSEQRKAAVRRYYDEAWSGKRLAVIDELFADDYQNHDPATPSGCVTGPEGFKQLLASFHEAFPDLNMRIDDQYCDGEVVITRWFASGTHRGTMMGIPPTARKGGAIGVTLTRFRGDRIVEDRAVWDALGLLRQLGAVA